MDLKALLQGKNGSKKITADQRVLLREMINAELTNEEIREELPNLPYYYIKNARARAAPKVSVTEAPTPISKLAQEFKSLAELQKTMRENDAALIAGLRAQVEAEQPLDDDTTNDRILETFLKVIEQKMAQPQPVVQPIQPVKPALEFAQKPIAPAGADSLTDDQILDILDKNVPKWAINLISSGTIKKKNAHAWLVIQRGVDPEIFERAWKLIR